jgi:hypothetical protein
MSEWTMETIVSRQGVPEYPLLFIAILDYIDLLAEDEDPTTL